MFFTVNKSKWKIEFVNPSSRHLQRSNGTWTLGVTDNNAKTVFISDNLSDAMIDKVLCHELCHVHAMEYDYYMPIEIEEIVADFMSLYGRNIIYLADDIMSNLYRRICRNGTRNSVKH